MAVKPIAKYGINADAPAISPKSGIAFTSIISIPLAEIYYWVDTSGSLKRPFYAIP
jgi:hypothetical protein